MLLGHCDTANQSPQYWLLACLPLWAGPKQQSTFALLLFFFLCFVLLSPPGSPHGSPWERDPFLREGADPEAKTGLFRFHLPPVHARSHRPRGPSPFAPAPLKRGRGAGSREPGGAGGGGSKPARPAGRSPCPPPLSAQPAASPPAGLSFVSRRRPPRSPALRRPRLRAAMLRRCPPGPPGPQPLRRALPPAAAAAVRRRLREVSARRGLRGGAGAGGRGRGLGLAASEAGRRCGGRAGRVTSLLAVRGADPGGRSGPRPAGAMSRAPEEGKFPCRRFRGAGCHR